MRNNVQPVRRHVVGTFHFGSRGLGHHDRGSGRRDQLGQQRAQSWLRIRRNVVQSRHERHSQRPNEVQEICAVLAAPDARSVLDIHHVHAAVIESMGDVRIVGLVVAPDSMADFGRVRSEFVGRMQRHDLPFADGGCEIVSERRDAALAR